MSLEILTFVRMRAKLIMIDTKKEHNFKENGTPSFRQDPVKIIEMLFY